VAGRFRNPADARACSTIYVLVNVSPISPLGRVLGSGVCTASFTLRHRQPVLNPDGTQAISAGGVRTHAGVRTGGGSEVRYAAARGAPNQEEQRTIVD
jgi:hypothetical protein